MLRAVGAASLDALIDGESAFEDLPRTLRIAQRGVDGSRNEQDIDVVRDARMEWKQLPKNWGDSPFLANGFLGVQVYAGSLSTSESVCRRLMDPRSTVILSTRTVASGRTRMPIGRSGGKSAREPPQLGRPQPALGYQRSCRDEERGGAQADVHAQVALAEITRSPGHLTHLSARPGGHPYPGGFLTNERSAAGRFWRALTSRSLT